MAAMTSIDVRVAEGQATTAPRSIPLRGVMQATTLAWVYVFYSLLRNEVTGTANAAQNNAGQILGIERFLHIDFEHTLQHWALQEKAVIGFCNTVYGATHQIVPVIGLVVLYRMAPARYALWRNTFVIMLAIALLCFWFYPLMPPHLMPSSYNFTDTSKGFFNLSRAPIRGALGGKADPTQTDILQFSNPYAAMPSLHVGWALWTQLALWPLCRRWWARLALVGYTLSMTLAVLVTANHWTFDVVGSLGALAIAYWVASRLPVSTKESAPAFD
jgi:hypothetical protein